MELFDRSQVEGLGGRLVQDLRHAALAFPAGDTFVVTFDPPPNEKLAGILAAQAMSVLRVSNSIAMANADTELSTSGKLNRRRSLEPGRAKVAAAIEKVAQQIEELVVLARLREAQLYDPEPIASGDFVTALDDQSIRGHWASMGPNALDAAMKAGELTHRHLVALMRSPVRLREPLQQIVSERWETSLETEQGKEFLAVQNDRDSASWALAAINQLRQIIERLAFHDPDAAMRIRPAPEEARAA
ncbi:MAG: hypothetical protein GC183_11745 [Thiobacillus sp.]|nr:hypothetical protein [Thiobacillus sp.]